MAQTSTSSSKAGGATKRYWRNLKQIAAKDQVRRDNVTPESKILPIAF